VRNDAVTRKAEGEISRREFAWFSLGGLSAMAGAAWAGMLAACSPSYRAQAVARAEDIAVGGSKIFTYPDQTHPCILLRPASDRYIAFSRLCTHTACPVFYRAADNVLACPCHGGAFSAADGSVLAGPPPKPLPRITLEQRGNELFATGVVKR
jgi:Rieske Fe-S protein